MTIFHFKEFFFIKAKDFISLRTLLSLFFLFSFTTINSQTATVEGTVKDSAGSGVENVYVGYVQAYKNLGIAGQTQPTGNGIVLGSVNGGIIFNEAYDFVERD